MRVRVTHFTHYPNYNLSIYRLFYLKISLGSIAYWISWWTLNPCIPGSNLGNRMNFFYHFFIFIFFYVFLSLLLQCKFAYSILLSLLRFSYFITPYYAQASSAFSALIKCTEYISFWNFLNLLCFVNNTDVLLGPFNIILCFLQCYSNVLLDFLRLYCHSGVHINIEIPYLNIFNTLKRNRNATLFQWQIH